jgi:hypothetical protein
MGFTQWVSPSSPHQGALFNRRIRADLSSSLSPPSLSVANISVPRQQVALATNGMWFGDNISSGILGLGLPALTASSNGSRGPDGRLYQVTYDPLVTTLGRQLESPVFSLSLHRNSSESFIAFGGVPPQVRTTGVWAVTPIEKLRRTDGVVDYFYYTVVPDGFEYGSPQRTLRASNMLAFIVDSGTTLNLLPYGKLQVTNHQPPYLLGSALGRDPRLTLIMKKRTGRLHQQPLHAPGHL